MIEIDLLFMTFKTIEIIKANQYFLFDWYRKFKNKYYLVAKCFVNIYLNKVKVKVEKNICLKMKKKEINKFK